MTVIKTIYCSPQCSPADNAKTRVLGPSSQKLMIILRAKLGTLEWGLSECIRMMELGLRDDSGCKVQRFSDHFISNMKATLEGHNYTES